MTEKNEKKLKKTKAQYGMGLGIMFGVAIGMANDNVGLWLVLGLCIGMAFDEARAKKIK